MLIVRGALLLLVLAAVPQAWKGTTSLSARCTMLTLLGVLAAWVAV